MNPYQKSSPGISSMSVYLKEPAESANPYLYNPKVLHPQQVFEQMESLAEQPSFYFGGSQIPIATNQNMVGSGIYKPSKKLKTDSRIITTLPISIPSIKHH